MNSNDNIEINALSEDKNNLEENNSVNFKQEKEKQNKKKFYFKRYKIQEVIKPNQVILVQVIKDERGQKGAALSTFYIHSWKIYCVNA